MQVTIKKISVDKTSISRKVEPYKDRHKIYVWPHGETIVENLYNRRNRPHTFYRKTVIPMLMEALRNDASQSEAYEILRWAKWSWNQKCGCSICPCSPGFVADIGGWGAYDVHVTITQDQIK